MTREAPFSRESLYAIGDLHGCLESLQQLLAQLPGRPQLIFLGDLVNRGPQSLETLRFVKKLEESGRAQCLLGNHDLHLLCVAAGHARPHGRDTIAPILEAADCGALIDWLRRQHLALYREDALFVHAGVHPDWSLEQALGLAREAEEQLSGPGWKDYLRDMYGDTQWSEGLAGAARMRAILNAFTRIRFIDRRTKELNFSVREGLAQAPASLEPWFEQQDRKLRGELIVFGHWSMLGLMMKPRLIAVDTGCLWGGTLSAVRMSDRRLFTVRSPLWRKPGGA